jgi:hypothetical protein
LDEGEKNSFIVLLEKGRNIGLLPQKTVSSGSCIVLNTYFRLEQGLKINDLISIHIRKLEKNHQQLPRKIEGRNNIDKRGN